MTVEPLAFRDTEVFALGRAVDTHRLVVLTGPPGIGKSAVAGDFVRQKRRGKLETVVACHLEGVRAAADLLHELARSLGLAAGADADAPAVAERIGRALAARRRPIVVLDDVDRCRVALAKLLPQWLRDAPGAVFVVTARGRLGVAAEHRLEIGPLEVPSAREREPDAIAARAAVQLFARRAAAVRPGFCVTAANARTVATIVRKLEGVPLALELSASRLVALSENDVAELLTERLDLLEDERGERSIRSAFALSWEELDEEDARLLAACSCFRGGFLLDAACAVASDGGGSSPKDRLRVARGLERLIEASLVRVGDGEERRYALPETLRVFAAEKLATLPDAALFEERHARHYASLRARSPAPPLDVIAAERENLERAFDRSLEARDPRGAALLLAHAPVALTQGPLTPFIDRASLALADLELAGADHAELLLSRGLARIFMGKREDALDDLERARREAERAGAPAIEAHATSKLALVIGLKGRVDEALALFADARRAADASADERTQGLVLKDLANLLSEAGRNDEAVVELARARRLFRAAGDRREEAFVLMMLGSRFVDDGRLEEARRDLGDGLTLLREVGDRRSETWTLLHLALADVEAGALSSARRQLDRAIALVRDVGDEHTEGLLLGYLGNVALEQGLTGDAESAYRDAIVRLARAADRHSEGFFTAASALVEQALGRGPAAADAIARARDLVRNDGRAARREAVEILASVVDGSIPERSRLERPTEEIRFAERMRALVATRAATKRDDEPGLVVASDGSWVRTASKQVAKLGAGRPIARVMLRLALERMRHPGRPVPAQALVRAGWPGERVLPAAAKNRLHVTIARLRRALLEGALLHGDDGYFLDPATAARVADPGEPPG